MGCKSLFQHFVRPKDLTFWNSDWGIFTFCHGIQLFGKPVKFPEFILWNILMVFLYQEPSVPAPFFWRHGPSGKSDITTFSSRVATALKWSTVRGFILTQADKFTLRKYLSSLKLVLASDTSSLYFLAVFFFFEPISHIQRGFQCMYKVWKVKYSSTNFLHKISCHHSLMRSIWAEV